LKRYFDPRNFAAPEAGCDDEQFTFHFWPNVT
jgi:hypothetical protein